MILGLCGTFGSGKDSAAKVLIEKYGFARVAFGDFLRSEISDHLDMYACLMPLVVKELPDEILTIMARHAYRGGVVYDKPYPEDVRFLLQYWGTDFRRKQDTDYWVKQMQHHLDQQIYRRNFVITDVRFPNEVELICGRYKGVMAEVVRDNHLNYSNDQLNRHASENSLKSLDIPLKIDNNGSIERLTDTVSSFIQGYI